MSTGTAAETVHTTPAGAGAPAGSKAVPAAGAAPRVTILRPRRGWQPLDVAELWRFRELLLFLIWRDVKVRYKQTVLGGMWALLQPVMTMVVFTVFFGRLGGMAQHVSVPYPAFAYAGLLAWTYFAAVVTQAANSLVNSSHLITKVYFPRLLLPLSAAGGGLVDLSVAGGLVFGLLAWYAVPITWQLVLLPVFLGLLVATAVGVGTLLAALVIAYRDFKHVLVFLLQSWMFASPLAYPLDVVPERWRLAYAVNPMVGVIDGFRAAVLGTPLRWDVLGVSIASGLSLLVVGLFYFKRVERRFADIV
jgi:lipopolysaccharide transport system permease protein